MKIKVDSYNLSDKGKRDSRLTIVITIDTVKAGIIETSAEVQLFPIAYFHDKIAEEAYGLLCLSAIVYAIDRSVDRHIHSINGWSREFDADIILPAYERFQENQSKINNMLSFLTGDYWNCQYVGAANFRYPRFKTHTYYDDIKQVTLFSGGLDSLIGAIDFLSEVNDDRLYLSSHYDKYMTGPRSDQEKVRQSLIGKYGNRVKYRDAVLISPGQSVEMSCRSRSLMFLSLATIVASYAQCDVVVPENGSVSLNFPLSPSRRASCSTRTTHPLFIKRYQEIINNLGLTPRVYNPYEFYTKGEMVQRCRDKEFLLDIVHQSNSCGKRNMHQQMYDNSKATHCAHCMPCMYRKAALVGEKDFTTYGNRLETIFNKKKDAISNDFFAMLDFLKRDLSRDDIKKELYIAGMSGFSTIDQYVDLVIRTRAELTRMLQAEESILINQYMGWA